MSRYDDLRQAYKPEIIKLLLIAESPPPSSEIASSRHFYRSDLIRRDDRLFANTIKALYPEAHDQTEIELEEAKEAWLKRLQKDGVYMIEALETSMRHKVTKEERQDHIRDALPLLLKRVGELANDDTEIILIKSNVFEVAAQPLKDGRYKVLNNMLVDYPGRFNQKAYREKLEHLTEYWRKSIK